MQLEPSLSLSVTWLCRKKDSWMCGANCRQPVGYRRWFGGDRLLFRKYDEQLFNLALLVRLGKAGSVHVSIMPLDLDYATRFGRTVCHRSTINTVLRTNYLR